MNPEHHPRPASPHARAVPGHPAPAASGTCRILLVEPGRAHRATLAACARPGRPVELVFADTLAEAREVLADIELDAAVVRDRLPDGSGFDLACELAGLPRPTATLIMGDQPDFNAACAALRAGADDFVLENVGVAELASRLDAALDRKSRERAHVARVARLHRLCKKLNRARIEVSEQVDLLCNDLVTAYQELACQMQNANQTGEFTSVVEDELDLETLLRKTLEHLILKVGPSNAAIFLPATLDEYSLGGYVNYDCDKTTVDGLLDTLADTLAPRVAESGEDLVHLESDPEIDRWTGGGLAPGDLRNTAAVAVPCISEGECLAVVTLFRSHDEAFDRDHLNLLSALGPALGAALERIIRVHHRTGFTPGLEGFEESEYGAEYEAEYEAEFEEGGDDDGYAGPDAFEPGADEEYPF